MKRIPGPFESDILRLLANVSAVKGERGHLTLADGKTAECRCFDGWGRSIRVAGMYFGGGDWITPANALKWAREQDRKRDAVHEIEYMRG